MHPHNRTAVAVIEPDGVLRHSLEFLLDADGYDARIYDGSSLPSVREMMEVACIVLSERIRPLGGVCILAQLRQATVVAPAILIAEQHTSEIQQRSAGLGVVKVLEKPLIYDLLLQAVRGAVTGAPGTRND